jgi:hypothetical protein
VWEAQLGRFCVHVEIFAFVRLLAYTGMSAANQQSTHPVGSLIAAGHTMAGNLVQANCTLYPLPVEQPGTVSIIISFTRYSACNHSGHRHKPLLCRLQ